MNTSERVHLERGPCYAEELTQRRGALRAELLPILAASPSFVWELGCGHGHFLTAYAETHPEKICIGVDIASERIARANRKRDRAKLGNLHFLRADARLFLEALPAGAAFTDLFILFPDPWPKLRHHKHRIIRPDFLTVAASRATPDTRLYFRTDFAPYFASASQLLEANAHWRITHDEWPFEFTTVFQGRAKSFQSLIARRASEADWK